MEDKVEWSSESKDKRPSLHWLADGDWLRVISAVVWLLLSFLSIAFCIFALVTFSRGDLGTAIIMALLGAVLKPSYGLLQCEGHHY